MKESRRYKCPRCGHIKISTLTRLHSHAVRKCGHQGCSRSLSRRHLLE